MLTLFSLVSNPFNFRLPIWRPSVDLACSARRPARSRDVGEMVKEVWKSIPDHFPNVELREYVIMPNHIHGIISITVEATHASPLPRISKGPMPGSIGAIIGSIKSAATRSFHKIQNSHENSLWQRNYYKHVIRNERDYQAIYDYILANPMNWEKDEEFSNP